MKPTVAVVAGVMALVVGIAVGGIGPRAEIRALRAQLNEAKECSQPAMGNDIANVFRGRPWEEGNPGSSRRVSRPPPNAAPPSDPDAPADEPSRLKIGGEDRALDDVTPEEGFALAREAMELRYAQARAALLEDARPSPQQLAQIDALTQSMNDKLVGLAQELVQQVSADGQPSRRDTMLYAAETLDALLTAESELRGVLDEGQIAALQDESLDPLSYVDPAILDVVGALGP